MTQTALIYGVALLFGGIAVYAWGRIARSLQADSDSRPDDWLREGNIRQ